MQVPVFDGSLTPRILKSSRLANLERVWNWPWAISSSVAASFPASEAFSRDLSG